MGWLLITLGAFATIATFLPANSAEQASASPWVFVPLGIILICAGIGVLLYCKRRTSDVEGFKG